MSIQILDTNGNIVNTYTTPQQISDDQGVLIAPAREDGNLASIKSNLDDIKTKLDTLISDEANLTNIKSDLDSILTDATSILAKLDVNLSTRASEATLASAKTDLDSILAKLDVALSTRASESTLSSVKTDLDEIALDTDNLSSIKTDLDSIDSKTPSLGQALMTGSQPVVIASNQTSVPISTNDSLYASDSYVTTSAYTNARPIQGNLNVRKLVTKNILISNTGANPVLINVFGSIDNGVTFDITLSAALSINAAASTTITDSSALTHIQIQAKDKNVGAHTTIVSKAYAFGV